jgi:hypothetical protein
MVAGQPVAGCPCACANPTAARPRGPFPMLADARPAAARPRALSRCLRTHLPAAARPRALPPSPSPPAHGVLSRCPRTHVPASARPWGRSRCPRMRVPPPPAPGPFPFPDARRPCVHAAAHPRGPLPMPATCIPAARLQGPFPMPADAPGDARQSRPDACQSRPEALPPARRHRERARGWASAGTRIHPGGGAFVFHRLYNNTYEHLRHCCIEYVRVWMHYLEDCQLFLDCTLGRQIRTSLVVKQLLSPNVLAPNIFVLVK